MIPPAPQDRLTPGDEPVAETVERSNRIHHEIVQLALLAAVAVGAFFLTRAVASANRRTSVRDAAQWYERGRRQLSGGETERAIESFRRAAVRNRADKRYGLSLAGALAADGQDASARRVLLSMREAAPEDPEVNVQLARLAADHGDLAEAVRYYHNALYAPWMAEHADARRQLRFELARSLLSHGQPGGALSELLALGADLPDQAAPRVELGRLLAKAGDNRHALEQFQRALRREPANGPALAGAGQAAFEVADYALAAKYLAAAPRDIEEVRETREIVEMVLARDPLASRLRSSERERRLRANLSDAGQRLAACLAGRPERAPDADDLARQGAAPSVEPRTRPPGTSDQDVVEAGMESTVRMAARAMEICPPPTPLDRALVLIGRRHGVSER